MASNNYIVRDIVQYIHDENEYKTSRSIFSVFEKLKANFWIFIIIVGVSAGAGYFAVYLPSIIAAQQAKVESQFEGLGGGSSEMKNRFEKLNPEEKAALMKQLGVGLGGNQ
jgi:hypothetical protein